MQAWQQYEVSLKAWLMKQSQNSALTEDILQETFIKALKQPKKICSLDNPKAWLFHVARNTLIDHQRTSHIATEPPDELTSLADENDPINAMQTCLIRALPELHDEDRHIIECCDLNGMPQLDYARLHALSLPSTKSRLRRARQRLKTHLTTACQVKFSHLGICDFTPRK
jgi:RNA polymerase sigma-70 factor (ECF subfamily)